MNTLGLLKEARASRSLCFIPPDNSFAFSPMWMSRSMKGILVYNSLVMIGPSKMDFKQSIFKFRIIDIVKAKINTLRSFPLQNHL